MGCSIQFVTLLRKFLKLGVFGEFTMYNKQKLGNNGLL